MSSPASSPRAHSPKTATPASPPPAIAVSRLTSATTESLHRDGDGVFPVRFVWSHACSSAGITGTFNNWGSQIALQRDDNEPKPAFSVTLYLPVGTHYFKYCVDGEWKYDPEVVFAPDEYGNLNNFVRVFALFDFDAGGVKLMQYPISTMLRDSPNGLPVMNPIAAEELAKLRSQNSTAAGATAASRNMRSPPSMLQRASGATSTAKTLATADPPPLVTHLRAPQETQDSEYDLDVDGRAHHSSSGGRSRSSTLTRSRSDESLAHTTAAQLTVDDGGMLTPKYTNHITDLSTASVLLAATTQHFGGDLVTHEHNQRAQQGGHRSSLVFGSSPGTTATPSTTSKKGGKLMLFLVGLPARGKTFIGHILARHLTWMGHQTQVFNSGEYRRRLVGAHVNHDFWDPHNADSAEIRKKIARQCLDDAISALETDACDCVIFDATNATRNRRRMLREVLLERFKCEMMYIESVYNEAGMIESSINDMKLNSADYAERTLEETADDYRRRIEHYHAVYETMDPEREAHVPFIRIVDVGRQIFANQVYGYLQSRIMFLMANLNLKPRPIWLSRHGESIYNTQKRIGGDSPLSPLGVQYAMQLDRFVNAYYPAPDTELAVWTSTMLRTGMTVERIAARGRTVVKWKQLDEIDAGICDGMTYEQVAEEMPEEYLARKNNKLHYRYPRGESYQDVIHRLEPVIMELMRIDKPVLIVAHQAILRVLYAYLTNKAPSECPTLNIPLHVVIQVTPRAYRCEEVWHRPM
ncbi:hypothetical protein ATCC90586_002825 [Pythium insidiosum]|nr:hypothetical protein ATCC90586_002825 [Pythium insidiosum]